MPRILPSLALLAVAATTLHAQRAQRARDAASDTLPFHAGQWGIEAGIGSSGTGVGALRFLDRSTALVLDFSASYSSVSGAIPFSTDDVSNSTGGVSARAGVRRYMPMANALASSVTVGASVSHFRTHSDPGDATSHQTGVGAFGAVGASYFVLPRLALSGSYGLDVQYQRSSGEQVIGDQSFHNRMHGWSVSTTGVRAAVGIFF
ncbi:MAG: hypothetical protein JO180_02135 [Gemmatirosa sp.]|nr:hypothetical protein [Gemmatirosa sp.]